MYGYEIVKTLNAQTGGVITAQEGALYPILYQLLETKAISEKRMPHKKRMIRIIYHLEPEGETLLDQLTAEFYLVENAMNQLLRCKLKETAIVAEDNQKDLQEDMEDERSAEIQKRNLFSAELLRQGEGLVCVPTQ